MEEEGGRRRFGGGFGDDGWKGVRMSGGRGGEEKILQFRVLLSVLLFHPHLCHF